jgi:hypothetical protein
MGGAYSVNLRELVFEQKSNQHIPKFPLSGRHGMHHDAIVRKDPVTLCETASYSVNVLEHVAGKNKIEKVVTKSRQVTRIYELKRDVWQFSGRKATNHFVSTDIHFCASQPLAESRNGLALAAVASTQFKGVAKAGSNWKSFHHHLELAAPHKFVPPVEIGPIRANITRREHPSLNSACHYI